MAIFLPAYLTKSSTTKSKPFSHVKPTAIIVCILTSIALTKCVFAYDKPTTEQCNESISRYVFSWPISDNCNDGPRGGTSKGSDVSVSSAIHSGWQAIQKPNLNKFQRDRAAILAMAGGYRVDFNFLETVGFSADFKRDKPYHSWGTEYVYVLEDKPHFISLQHLMVMYFKQEDGSTSEPFVMKHWRQDWTYQDTSLLEYKHNNTWVTREIEQTEAKGSWSQAVFQVDDSPRYESLGRWVHNASFSSWLSDTTRRPLPRREYSVRQDYNVLEGINRHTVTRTGWVQEEENWKLLLDEDGKASSTNPYLSKEQGLARYQLTENVDFTPGDRYMQQTKAFWAAVRDEWNSIINKSTALSLHKTVDDQPLFIPLFDAATAETDIDESKKLIRQTISQYIRD